MIFLLVVLQLLFIFVTSKHVSGVFTNFDSLEFSDINEYGHAFPNMPSWIAEMSWAIEGSKMEAGDTFTLNMPCVFKFTTTEPTLSLNVGSTDYATCHFVPSDLLLSYSELKCKILPTVTKSTSASGKLTFPFTFNPGFSALETDLQCSNYLKDGLNTIYFHDGDNLLSTETSLERGALTDPNAIVYSLRKIPTLNKQQQYLLAGNCENGYAAGSLGIVVKDKSGKLDCSSFHTAISNSLNYWYYPKNTDPSFQLQTSCRSNYIMIEYDNVPAGYRIFLDGLVSVETDVRFSVSYINAYKCANSTQVIDNSEEVRWIPYVNDYAGANGKEVDVETSTWTGSTTQISTKPYEETDPTITIIVDVPIPTVTYSSTYVGISTSYITYTVTPGETASIIEFVPVHTTVTEITCDEIEDTVTCTISTSTWATDTIYIITPCEDSIESTEESTEEPSTEESTEPPSTEESTEPPSTEESTEPPSTEQPTEEPSTEQPTIEQTTTEIKPTQKSEEHLSTDCHITKESLTEEPTTSDVSTIIPSAYESNQIIQTISSVVTEGVSTTTILHSVTVTSTSYSNIDHSQLTAPEVEPTYQEGVGSSTDITKLNLLFVLIIGIFV